MHLFISNATLSWRVNSQVHLGVQNSSYIGEIPFEETTSLFNMTY